MCMAEGKTLQNGSKKKKVIYRAFLLDGIVCCFCNKIRPITHPLTMEAK